jgi:AcrR family transcriptional regulator
LGLAERKERERADLKQLILSSAKKLLTTLGHDGLSIRKIATDIEYSPTTIYLYFKDKDEILHELMESGFVVMNKYMSKAFQEEDATQRILKTGHAYLEFGMKNKDWYDIMFNSDKPMKHIQECQEDWDQGMAMFQTIVNTCAEALPASKNANLDPKIVALQLWSCVHGLVNLANSDRLEIVEQNQKETLIAQTLEVMWKSLFKS